MRFLLVLAPLLLLIQPVQNGTSIGPAETSADSTLDALTIDELNTKLLLAQDKAKNKCDKVANATEELRKKEEDVGILEGVYEEKKKDWEEKDKDARLKTTEQTEKAQTTSLEFDLAQTNLSLAQDAVEQAEEDFQKVQKIVTAYKELAICKPSKPCTSKELSDMAIAVKKKKDDYKNNFVDPSTQIVTDNKCKESGNENIPVCVKPLEDLKNYEPKLKAETAKFDEIDANKLKLNAYIVLKNKITKEDISSADLDKLEIDGQERVDSAKSVRDSANQTFFEKKIAKDDSETYSIPEEGLATQAFTDMGKAKTLLDTAKEPVSKMKEKLGEQKKECDEDNNKVAALSGHIEKRREKTSTGSFPWWIIIVALVILVVAAVAIGWFIVLRSRINKKTTEGCVNAPIHLPTSTTKSKEDVNAKSRSTSKETQAPQEANSTEIMIEIVTNSSELSPAIKAVLDRDAKPNSKIVKKRYPTAGVFPPKTEVEYESKSGLKGIVNENGIWREEVEVDNFVWKYNAVILPQYTHHDNIHAKKAALAPITEIIWDQKRCTVTNFVGGMKGEDTVTKADDERAGAGKADDESESRKNSGSKDKKKKHEEQESSNKKSESEKMTATNVTATRVNQSGTTTMGQSGGSGATLAEAEEMMKWIVFDEKNIDGLLTDLSKYENVVHHKTGLEKNLDTSNRFKFNAKFIMQLLENIYPRLKKEDQLMKISHPCVFVADLHGQFDTLLQMFSLFDVGEMPGWTQMRYVFMGDYVDRGSQNLEVMIFLFLLKIKSPDCFALCRGNHETRTINIVYGFQDEIIDRFVKNRNNKDEMAVAEEIFNKFNDVFNVMSHACLVSEAILCVHGGVSPNLTRLDQYNDIERPCKHPANGWNNGKDLLAIETVWNDYFFGHLDEPRFNKNRGQGWQLGPKQVMESQKTLNILLNVRGHQQMMNGLMNFFGRLISVFTCSQYVDRTKAITIGGVLVLDKDGVFSSRLMIKGHCTPIEFKKKYEQNSRENHDLPSSMTSGNKPPPPPNDNDITAVGTQAGLVAV